MQNKSVKKGIFCILLACCLPALVACMYPNLSEKELFDDIMFSELFVENDWVLVDYEIEEESRTGRTLCVTVFTHGYYRDNHAKEFASRCLITYQLYEKYNRLIGLEYAVYDEDFWIFESIELLP